MEEVALPFLPLFLTKHFIQFFSFPFSLSSSRPPVMMEHSSTTPGNHSTDYAIPSTLFNTYQRDQQHQQLQILQNKFPPVPCIIEPPNIGPPSTAPPSTGPPSMANYTSSATSSPQFITKRCDLHTPHANMLTCDSHMQLQTDRLGAYEERGRSSMQDYYNDSSSPEDYMSRADELRKMSVETTHKFVDTLTRVHSPPPISNHTLYHLQLQNLSSGHLTERTPSDQRDEPLWNPISASQGHMTGQPNHVGGHMTSQLGAHGEYSVECFNSREFRGASYPEKATQLIQGAKNLAPSMQSSHSQSDCQDSYLMRADEILMKELSRGQGASTDGVWSRQTEVHGYHIGNDHTHSERNHNEYSETMSRPTTCSPGVHASHSTSLKIGSSIQQHASDYNSDPDRAYDVPPSIHSDLDRAYDVPPSIHSDPDRAYDVPPSIHSNLDRAYDVLPSIHSDPDRAYDVPPSIHSDPDRAYDVPPSIHSDPDRAYDVPPSIHSDPDRAYDVPPSIHSDLDPVYDVPSSRPARHQFPQHSESLCPPPPFAAPHPPVQTQRMSPLPLHSDLMRAMAPPSQHTPHPPHHTPHTPTADQQAHLPNHHPSTNGTRMCVINVHNSMPDQTRHVPSSSSQTPPTTSHTHNTLLVTQVSSQSSIASGWSLDHIQKHMEKRAQRLSDLLISADEGSEGVDWDTPTGPHMNNSHHCSNFQPVTPHQPLVDFKKNFKKRHVTDAEEPISFSTSFAINKQQVNMPHQANIKPYRPKLKGKHIPGSIWEPRSVNRAIQSSSEESIDSCCTSVVATDTLRSAHV